MMKKALAILSSAALVLLCVWAVFPNRNRASDSNETSDNVLEYVSTRSASAAVDGVPTYSDYAQQMGNVARPTTPLILSAVENYTADEKANVWVETLDGVEALVTNETGRVTWTFTVENAGFYDLFFRYRGVTGKGGTIERALYLDGELPFSEARDLIFNRVYKDDGEKIYSKLGNEYRRPQKECLIWQTVRAVSNATFNDEGISLYLTAGTHTLSLEGVAEPMALAEIRFEQAPAALPYREQLAQWKAAGYTAYDGSMISVQGEDASYKSTNTLYAVENRTSSLTEPFDLKLTQLNCIGDNNWKYKHQWRSEEHTSELQSR